MANSALKVMKSADGLALHFGIFLDYPLSRKIGLKFGANFDWVNFLNTKTGDLSVKTTDGQIFTGQEEMQFKITGLYSGLTVLLRCNITPNLYISGGPGFFLETGKFNLDFTETSLSSNIQYIDEKGNPTRSISCKLNLEKIQCLEKVYNTI